MGGESVLCRSVSTGSGRRRAVLGLVTTVALVALGLCLNPARAFAAPSVAASSVDAGQRTTITVNGCSDPTLYSGATFAIADSTGTVVDQGVVDKWTFAWTTNDPDLYTVTINCKGYNSVSDASASATFAMWPTFIDISPDTWNLGQPVTLQAVGFTPGENVQLRLTSDSSADPIKSWSTTAVVDDSALWSFAVSLPRDLKAGTYYLAATGSQSGTTRVGGFRIIEGGSGSSNPTTPPSGGGLPKTGH